MEKGINRKTLILIITGILYILSLFTKNKIIMDITQCIFIGTYFWYAIILIMKDRNISFIDINRVSKKRSKECYRNKQYLMSIIYFMLFPIIIFGLLWMILMCIMFYFI